MPPPRGGGEVVVYKPRLPTFRRTASSWALVAGVPPRRCVSRRPGPPADVRRNAASPVGTLQACAVRLCESERAWAQWEAHRRAQAVRLALREVSYPEAYEAAHAFPARPCGPLQLLQPAYFDVLLSWLGSRAASPDSRQLLALGGRSLVYRLGFGILGLASPGRRRLAARRWRFGSALIGELPWAFSVLRAPREVPSAAFGALAGSLFRELSAGCPWRYAWLRRRTCVVRDVEVGCVSTRRQSLDRSVLWTSTPLPQVNERMRCRAWTSSGTKSTGRPRFTALWPLCGVRPPATWPHGSKPTASCPADPSRGLGDRRCPRSPAASADAYGARPRGGASAGKPGGGPGHRRQGHSGGVDVLATPLRLALRPLPRAGRGLAPHAAVAGWGRGRLMEEHRSPGLVGLVRPASLAAYEAGLPSVYTTMKSKCFQTGSRTCTRAGHSCVRRIRSWSSYPHRELLRRAGRAWRVALLSLGVGDSTSSLARAARDLRMRAARLGRPRAEGQCSSCRAACPPYNAMVMDASAMYERIPASQVELAAAFFVRVLAGKGATGILVEHARALRGRLWRHGGAYRADAVFVPLSSPGACASATHD